MSSLYIQGAQCVHAEFSNPENDVEEFDSHEERLDELAKACNVHIERACLEDQGDHCFIVMNEKKRAQCFYEGAAFEVDMSVAVSDTFEERARAFIHALHADASLSAFHQLSWMGPRVLYIVTS